MLKNVKFVSLITDCWTSAVTTDGYITVTCHFMNNFKITSIVLETEKIVGSHTAEHLAEYLKVFY
jgi:hypothetical protein